MRDLILSKRENYIASLIRQRPELLAVIEHRLRQDGKWGINLSDIEGQFLSILIEMNQSQNVLELGTQYGYSTQWLLKNLLPNARLTTIEKSFEHWSVAQEFLTDPRVTSVAADAKEWLGQYKGPLFDFIFIDAEKGGYPEYLALSEKWLAPGGVLVADNTMAWEAVIETEYPKGSKASRNQWSQMRVFNERLAQSENFTSVLLPTVEGLTVAYRRK